MIVLLIASCGPPRDAFQDAKDYAGERANSARKYLSDRNLSSETIQDRYKAAQEYAGRKANEVRDYIYRRGLCEMRHGDYCGSTHGDKTDGTNGTNGNDGDSTTGTNGTNGTNGTGTDGNDGNNGSDGVGTTGATGATGSTGTTGASGTNGTNGSNGTNGATGATGATGPMGSVAALGPAPVNLGLASNFSILTKAGITNVPGSIIIGDIGTSPITGASIVALDCIEVLGSIYTVDAAGPACRSTNPLYLTSAVADMQTAYNDAKDRVSPDTTELASGLIGGLTIAPGLHKWGTGVTATTDVTLAGGPNDVWIFQVAGNLTVASAVRVKLSGGAQAKNVFWQVAGSTSIGTSAHVEGTILCKTLVAMFTGATLNGRAFAQTEVTLQTNVVNRP